MQLVLDHTGLRVKVKNGCFLISNAEQCRLISPARLTSIVISSPLTISSSALMLAVRNNIPVIITDAKNDLHATLTSAAYSNLPTSRRQQLLFCSSEAALTYMAQLLLIKFGQQISNLCTWQKQLSKQEPVLDELLHKSTEKYECVKEDWQSRQVFTKEQLTTAEAIIAGYYWRAVTYVAPEEYPITTRGFRPARDMYNATLNYWYGMLYQQVETSIYACGLDASCSMLHAEDYQTPALCFDLIEPFRPQADVAVMGLCQNQVLQKYHFTDVENGLWLSKKGKQLIIPAFHAWMHEKIAFGKRNTLRKNHILQLPASLLKHIRSLYEEP